MFRYMAFSWDPNDLSQADTAQALKHRLLATSGEWREIAHCRNSAVFCTGLKPGINEAHLLHGQVGVILGALFERSKSDDTVPQKARLEEHATARILGSKGKYLIDYYWGRYVAFICDERSNRQWILRDPTSNLPCFISKFRGVTIVFSSISDCAHLGVQIFTVNWNYLAQRLALGVFEPQGTGLNEVSKLCGGECMEISGQQVTRTFYWHPCTIANSELIEDSEIAARRLRSTVRCAVHSWAACYSSIVHKLSGGLDSSIILGCLADAPSQPRITCLTYCSPAGVVSAERHYARIASQHTRCEHVEQTRDATAIHLQDIQNFALSVGPDPIMAVVETSRFEQQIAERNLATAIWTGDGGDSFFAGHSRTHSATDYVRRHRIGPRLIGIASNVALHSNLSVWKILTDAIHQGIRKPRWERLQTIIGDRKLLSSSVRESVLRNPSLHPWFDAIESVPPGVAEMIMSLVVPYRYYDPFSGPEESRAETVFPLYSQPVVELCLRIPTEVHNHHGRERGLARKAFSGSVPEQILTRHWKDRGPNFFQTVLQHNIGFAREFLLDGTLVQRHLLDRKVVEEDLAGVPTRGAGNISEILDCLLVEAWLSRWIAVPQQAAA